MSADETADPVLGMDRPDYSKNRKAATQMTIPIDTSSEHEMYVRALDVNIRAASARLRISPDKERLDESVVQLGLSRLDLLEVLLYTGGHFEDGPPWALHQFMGSTELQRADEIVHTFLHSPASESIIKQMIRDIDRFVDTETVLIAAKADAVGDNEVRASIMAAQREVLARLLTLQSLDEATMAKQRAAAAEADAARSAAEAQQSAIYVKEVSGQEAVGELSKHFADYASTEKIAADRWRIAAVLTLVTLATAAYWLLHGVQLPTPLPFFVEQSSPSRLAY